MAVSAFVELPAPPTLPGCPSVFQYVLPISSYSPRVSVARRPERSSVPVCCAVAKGRLAVPAGQREEKKSAAERQARGEVGWVGGRGVD